MVFKLKITLHCRRGIINNVDYSDIFLHLKYKTGQRQDQNPTHTPPEKHKCIDKAWE